MSGLFVCVLAIANPDYLDGKVIVEDGMNDAVIANVDSITVL
ncbi:MAG: hypothetical protein WCQ50_05570 [Spirochaetota bacterium]